MTAVPLVLASAVAVAAAVTDLRTGKIKNVLTFPAMAAGLLWHSITGGTEGFLFAAGGLALGFGVPLAFYALGWFGAGDVKLLGAVGAFLGPRGAVSAMLLGSLAGGVHALGVLLFTQGYGAAFLHAVANAFRAFMKTAAVAYDPPKDFEKRRGLRYGVALAVGTLATVALEALGHPLKLW